MARSRSHRRGHARSNPRGLISVISRGSGFVTTAEGSYYIPLRNMRGAFDGDLVEISPLTVKHKSRQKRQGTNDKHEKPLARVVQVIERAYETLVGRYEVAEPFGVVVPLNKQVHYDIFTKRADRPDIPDGSLVRVRIIAFPSRHTAATGIVEAVLKDDCESDKQANLIVAEFKLETSFSVASVSAAAAALLDKQGALAAGYRDITKRLVLTIDPEDAKDFDDAISLEKIDSQAFAKVLRRFPGRLKAKTGLLMQKAKSAAVWRLGVHIADVSHYVPWNSSIDLDARRRSTSVYLSDRVIPLLPENLSENLCSLKPHEVRRTLSVDIYLDQQAEVVYYELYPALICSDYRLSYEEAQRYLDETACSKDAIDGFISDTQPESAGTGKGARGDKGLIERLCVLSMLARKRFERRLEAGGLEFPSVEVKMSLDKDGHPLDLHFKYKTQATSLIEEAMILANQIVARFMSMNCFPSLYRIHDQPSKESLDELACVLRDFSWFKSIDEAKLTAGKPEAFEAVLTASAHCPEKELVSMLLLRAMKRAVYSSRRLPHFGLASEAYTHFTSPIRRYPDLVVHRMLKAQLRKKPAGYCDEVKALSWLSEHASYAERVAEKASRASQEQKIIEFMQPAIGTTFEALITGVTAEFLYVRLSNTAAGSVVLNTKEGEKFNYDASFYKVVGSVTGTVFKRGQRVVVKLLVANPEERILRFCVV